MSDIIIAFDSLVYLCNQFGIMTLKKGHEKLFTLLFLLHFFICLR